MSLHYAVAASALLIMLCQRIAVERRLLICLTPAVHTGLFCAVLMLFLLSLDLHSLLQWQIARTSQCTVPLLHWHVDKRCWASA